MSERDAGAPRIFYLPEWGQFWPILLILAGGFPLLNRTAER